MLTEEEPKRVLDKFAAMTGLPVPNRLPPRTPEVVTYRTGYLDTSGYGRGWVSSAFRVTSLTLPERTCHTSSGSCMETFVVAKPPGQSYTGFGGFFYGWPPQTSIFGKGGTNHGEWNS